MTNVFISLAIFIVMYVFFSLFLYFNKKKSDINKTPYNFHFGSQFFAVALFPTIIITIIVANSFFEFVAVYAYFILLVFLSNKLYKKHNNKEW